jgi:hypothetical protein
MTRLELIAQIVREMAEDLKADNDRADEKELKRLSDREDLTFDPHIIKLVRDE